MTSYYNIYKFIYSNHVTCYYFLISFSTFLYHQKGLVPKYYFTGSSAQKRSPSYILNLYIIMTVNCIKKQYSKVQTDFVGNLSQKKNVLKNR